MRTSRRGLFGLIAGALGAAVLGKEVVSTNLDGGDVKRLVVGRASSPNTMLFYSNASVATYTLDSNVTVLKTVCLPKQKAIRVDMEIKDLKRGNPRDQLWTKVT